ncbi:DivIVA domain-containing protein [Eggerthia catenaformis]|uniref:DivIVA domain-containing protein n=1 Tax=Eggerthia catenaformis TaxID=31973 RepID=UPI0028ECF86E|nr:DivIVA domain-containing protein [Eggerthia catenaformis]
MERNFKRGLLGYKKKDVNMYLDTVSQTMSELNKQIADLKAQLQRVNEEKAFLVQRDTVTQKTNEEIARLALKEASALIDKAKKNANMILKESMEYVKGLDHEVNGFKDEAKDFRNQIVKISEELLETIDNSEIFSLIKEEENTKKETDRF